MENHVALLYATVIQTWFPFACVIIALLANPKLLRHTCAWCRVLLHEFLDGYKHDGGLAVHMVLVGPSGRETRPATGGVLPYYSQCGSEPERMVKVRTGIDLLST